MLEPTQGGEDEEWWGGKSGDEIIPSVNEEAGKKLVGSSWPGMWGRRLGGVKVTTKSSEYDYLFNGIVL